MPVPRRFQMDEWRKQDSVYNIFILYFVVYVCPTMHKNLFPIKYLVYFKLELLVTKHSIWKIWKDHLYYKDR